MRFSLLLVLCVFMSAYAQAQTQEQIDAYVHWCKENGVDFKHVEIKANPDAEHLFYESRHDPWVVVAKEHVPKETELFYVPESLTISPASAMESEKYGYVFKKPLEMVVEDDGNMVQSSANTPVIPYTSVVALTLLLERLDSESFWKPWLDVLPDKVLTGLTYTKKELEELVGTSGGYTIFQRRRSFEYEYDKEILPLIEKYPEVFSNPADFSKEAYLNSLSVVLGYGHVSNKTDGQIYVSMVPVLDLIPPRICETRIESFATREDKQLTVVSDHGFEPNTRIVVSSYYLLLNTNIELLLYRGEALNDVRYFTLPISVNMDCDKNAGPGDMCVRKKALLETVGGSSNRQLMIYYGGIPLEYVVLSRITHISDEADLDRVDTLRRGRALSVENEARTFDTLLDRMQQHLDAYPTLVEEDELRLKKKKIKSDAIRGIVIFRYGEKRAVIETQRLARVEQTKLLDKLGEENRRKNKKAMKKRKSN
eukprot:TRINITY_DN2058_c0_g1_i1.p1 TRINITY_DN2058_c0_g1~~TRINITY_DN2058_c0_g1_i1.p1  ORF type:complete len:482 (-),score=117.41 TRINITY_DN2058_c0_g1_i1:126-1571(-)